MESRQNVPAGMEIKIKMKIVETIAEVRAQVKEWRAQGLSVGLVPTMGYLHEGHKSLIDRAVAENDKVVVSVFVNPMQFGVGEDLESYPRDMERDSALNTLTKGLCGKTRPIHFRGVCTVVSKLFNIVQPDKAYFGQKDAQQLAVIRHMVSDLNFGIEIVGCPIVREADGLAKSSRNTYLNEQERKAAVVLNQSLQAAQDLYENGERSAAVLSAAIREKLAAEPLAKPDYVEIVDWNTLEPVETIQDSVLMAIAVYIGKTRLIDNRIL